MKNNILHLFHHKQNHQNLHNTYLNQEVDYSAHVFGTSF
jgi:hypothetical protein